LACPADRIGSASPLSLSAGVVLAARCAASRPRCCCSSAVRCRTTSGVHDLVLRLNRRFGPLSRCRFFIALHVRGKRRALLVFFLRTLGGDTRRWLRWILHPPRRSFKLSVLVDR